MYLVLTSDAEETGTLPEQFRASSTAVGYEVGPPLGSTRRSIAEGHWRAMKKLTLHPIIDPAPARLRRWLGAVMLLLLLLLLFTGCAGNLPTVDHQAIATRAIPQSDQGAWRQDGGHDQLAGLHRQPGGACRLHALPRRDAETGHGPARDQRRAAVALARRERGGHHRRFSPSASQRGWQKTVRLKAAVYSFATGAERMRSASVDISIQSFSCLIPLFRTKCRSIFSLLSTGPEKSRTSIRR